MFDQELEEPPIDGVLLSHRLLQSQEEFWRRERDLDPLNGGPIDAGSRLGVFDTTGALHQVDDDFVRDPDDDVTIEVGWPDFAHRVIGQDGKRLLNSFEVDGRRIDEEVNVPGGPDEPGVNDGHPADDDVQGAVCVEGAADRQEVVEEGRTGLEDLAIIRIAHS